MKTQLEFLLKRGQEPNVMILVVPDTAQNLPAVSFTLLSFDTEPDIAYEEGASGQGNLIGAGPRVTNLRVEIDMIASVALSGTESEECVRGILESM